MNTYRRARFASLAMVVCTGAWQIGCEQGAKLGKDAAEAAERRAKEPGGVFHGTPEDLAAASQKAKTDFGMSRAPAGRFDDGELRNKVFARMKECDIEAGVPEIMKDSTDAAVEARKSPFATEESVSRATRLAALNSANKNGIKLPVSALECVVQSATGALFE